MVGVWWAVKVECLYLLKQGKGIKNENMINELGAKQEKTIKS